MKNKYKGILVLLSTLFVLTFTISVVCAEDVSTHEDNIAIENEISTTDNSKNASIKTSNKPTKVSQAKIISAAKNLKTYAESNKKLPDYVTVSDYKFSIPEFYYLMSKTITNKNKKINSDIIVKYDVKNPSKASGTWIRGNIYSYYYSIYANKIMTYINKNKKAPNYITTAGGSKLQYQSNVYLFAKVLSATKK